MTSQAWAATTNAWWQFPTSGTFTPTQPISPTIANYSAGDTMNWSLSNPTKASVSYTDRGGGNGYALNFTHDNNQVSALNGSTLTSTINVTGLSVNTLFTNIQLSYEAQCTGNSGMASTWAYSLNGSLFQNFTTNSFSSGAGWGSFGSSLPTMLTLTNGDVLVIRATMAGATGKNHNLSFDNIAIWGNVVAVPEPQTITLIGLGALLLASRFRRR